MRGRFWAGLLLGGLLVAALNRAGARPGRWLDRLGRRGRQLLESRAPRALRRLLGWRPPKTRRWLARVGTR